MKTGSAKAKGRRLQQWVCQKLSDITGIAWGEDELIQSRGMGQNGADVMLMGEAKELIRFDIEIKNQEKWALPAYIEQAKANTKEGRNWLLVLSKNRFKPIVVVDADVFFELFQKTLDKSKK